MQHFKINQDFKNQLENDGLRKIFIIRTVSAVFLGLFRKFFFSECINLLPEIMSCPCMLVVCLLM